MVASRRHAAPRVEPTAGVWSTPVSSLIMLARRRDSETLFFIPPSRTTTVKVFFLVTAMMLYPATLIANSGVKQAIEAVEGFLANSYGSSESNFRWRVKQPDHRLLLSACESPPDLEPPSDLKKMGKISFKVSCPSPTPWSIYLSTTVHQRVSTWESIVPISRDEVIHRSHLEKRDRWYTSLPSGLITSADQIVGKVARQNILPGDPIREKCLRDAILVRKGHLVRANITTPGFSVGTQVIALEEGARGETIQVRNAKTEKLMTAVVDGAGRVTLH